MAPTPFTNFGITQWISISQRMYICELVGKLSFPGGGGTHGRSSSKTLHPFPQFSPLIPRSELDASPDTHDLSPKMGYPKKRQEVDDRGISVTALEPFVPSGPLSIWPVSGVLQR